MHNFFGLDLGTSEVRVLQAEKEKTGFKIKHFARTGVSSGVEPEAIKAAMKEAKIKGSVEVNVALPESDVYARIITTPKLSTTELSSSIQFEAEQYVPVPLEEVELYHQIISGGDEPDQTSMDVLLIAVTKTRLKQLTSLLDVAGLIPRSLETELFSLHRVVGNPGKSQLVVSFGYKTTDMMVLNKSRPVFLHSFSSGGLALTRALVNELSLSDEQAEQYKRTYGLREELLEGKVAKALVPLIDEVVTQINKALVYVQQQGKYSQPEQVVMAGGGALLPGLTGYLVEKLNLEVVVADPFIGFVKDDDFSKLVTSEANPDLATVGGLAIKGLV